MKKKRLWVARISGIQRCLEKYHSRKLLGLEKELRADLEHILEEEELLWKLKCHSDWLAFGDRNISYFHSQTNKRRRKNHILSLRMADGSCCFSKKFVYYGVDR